MEAIVNHKTLRLLHGDITVLEADAIVNAANPSLMGGGGVDGAIHTAGGPAILEECQRIVAQQGPLAPGQAVITTGGRLPARYVIHTVGPIWRGGDHGEPATLASAYRESLKLASAHALQRIVFPSISTGAYGYPLDQAAEVALGAVLAFLREEATSVAEVAFVLYNRPALGAYEKALGHWQERAAPRGAASQGTGPP